MSYSTDVKSEICSNADARQCCDRAMLNSAFAFFNTVNSKSVRFRTSSRSAALYLYALIKDLTGVSFDISRSRESCLLSCDDEEKIRTAAEKAGLINPKTNQISCELKGSYSVNECCRRSAVRGAFLAAGYVASPRKAYHLEITSHRKKPLNQVLELMLSLGIEARMITRNSRYVLYLKEKEQISDMLSLLGAKKSYFDYQETILEKDMKNKLNRKQNFEQANLDKTLDASIEQCGAIYKIKSKGSFETLSPELKEAAFLRLENPHASLGELAAMTSDKVSRSGMNHRLKRLIELGRVL